MSSDDLSRSIGPAAEPPSPFLGARGYLDTATAGLPAPGAIAALASHLAEWERGEVDIWRWDEPVGRARRAYASIVGVPASWVAVGSQVSAVAGIVAASLPTGSKVVMAEGEFSSLVFPFLVQERRGVKVEMVDHSQVISEVAQGADWVVVSAVQSANGAVVDLDALAEAAALGGARVLLDCTQAAGWLPVDGGAFDVVTAAAYKWLLAPRGTCLTSIRPEIVEELPAHSAGWYAGQDVGSSFYGAPLRLAADARRFDVSPSWLAWAGAYQGMEHLASLGVEEVHRHNVGLANAFCDAVGEDRANSAIVSLQAHNDVLEKLSSSGIRCSSRAGRVRLAFHVYNDYEDVDQAASAWSR